MGRERSVARATAPARPIPTMVTMIMTARVRALASAVWIDCVLKPTKMVPMGTWL